MGKSFGSLQYNSYICEQEAINIHKTLLANMEHV